MSEPVLIALVSTLSGFIVAFLAEPVKTYVQNRAKLKNLRIALYKEMSINYAVLNTLAPDDYSTFEWGGNNPAYALRAECYKHALENEISTFYQMQEANLINLLMGACVLHIIEGFRHLGNLSEEQLSKDLPRYTESYLNTSTNFKDVFAASFYDGQFDRRILTDIIQQPTYEEIMKRGKEYSERRVSKQATH